MATLRTQHARVEHRVVSIYDLIPHTENYNQHPQNQLEDLKASLRRYSQVEDTVVKALPDGKYQIAAHEGITTAAKQLLEAGECSHLEQWGITIVPDHWDELEVKGYMITSNETARKSSPDDSLLAALLEEQQEAGYNLASLGSDEFALQDMLAKSTPPTLDELEEKYGSEPEPDAFWPVIRVKVSPDTKELYDSLLEEAPGTDEGVKFGWLLERVNLADGEEEDGEDDE